MSFLEAVRKVYDGEAYGCRPCSWPRNGDVYRFQDGRWVMEFNESHWATFVRMPEISTLFGEWEYVCKDVVDQERRRSK